MGLTFDIIEDTGELIDRYPIGWLYNYDTSFFNLFQNVNNNPVDVIVYCEEQIKILTEKLNESYKIGKIKCLEFNEKKEYLVNLIVNTNNDEEINKLIEKLYIIIYQDIEDNNLALLSKFKILKLFSERYSNNKCEISY